MTREDAERLGFELDTTVYPWVAYKGPRFAPTEWHICLTDLEAQQAERIRELEEVNHDR